MYMQKYIKTNKWENHPAIEYAGKYDKLLYVEPVLPSKNPVLPSVLVAALLYKVLYCPMLSSSGEFEYNSF